MIRLESPTPVGDDLPTLELEDLWDWAYCPMRLWWRKAQGKPDEAEAALPTGANLIRSAVRGSIASTYAGAGGRAGERSLYQAFGAVWREWLTGWSMEDAIVDDLLEYHASRTEILARFGPKGDLRRPDGSLYRRPTWTKAWAELSAEAGLQDVEKRIDLVVRAGRAPRRLRSSDTGLAPEIGLAEAFSIGLGIIDHLKSLPDADTILAAGSWAEAELLSARLKCRVDLVVDLGEKPLRGRPPKGTEGPRLGRRVAYELHLFDEDAPTAASLRHDLRVLALSLAEPSGLQLSEQTVAVERIDVRHMRTGRVEQIRPLEGEGAEVLEGLARAALVGIHSGAFIPRMVCGWHACGDCEYRPACFAGKGIMQALNPPLLTQIQVNQQFHDDLRELIMGQEVGRRAVGVCRDFASWLSATPGMTPQGALWILNALESETS